MEGTETAETTGTIWTLVDKQARARPQQTAVLDGETAIGYGHLARRADTIAGELLARGVEPG